MAGVVFLFIFIMSSVFIVEAIRLKPKLPKVSARRHGLGVTAEDSPGCIPGEFYRGHNCQQCFCTENGLKICSGPLTCKMDEKEPSRNELIHIFNPTRLSRLPAVDDAAARCKPGKGYRMDCNRCICTRARSLFCENLLCPIYDDANKLRAKELSGNPCETEDTMNEDCIKCSCKNGKFACDFIPNCNPERSISIPVNGKSNSVHTLGNRKQCIPGQKFLDRPNKPPCICTLKGRLECPTTLSRPRSPRPFDAAFLDPRSGKKCVPGVYYIKDCNRCACSQKRLLHCTTMTCLHQNRTLAHSHTHIPRLLALQEKTVRPPKHEGTAYSDSSTKERGTKKTILMPFEKAFEKGKKCEPGVMYRKQCNKCSCTRDRSLICTTMACPSKKELNVLKKLRQKLEKEDKII